MDVDYSDIVAAEENIKTLSQRHNKLLALSTDNNGVLDETAYNMGFEALVGKYAEGREHVRGYFYLPDFEKSTKQNNDRMSMIFNDPIEPYRKKDPYTPKELGDLELRFNLAFEGTYASAYKRRRFRGIPGEDIYEDIRKTAFHVFQRYLITPNANGFNKNETEALEDTMKTLFGDKVFLRNGGSEYPNGLGLWVDRNLMNEFGLDANVINDNMPVSFYKVIKDLRLRAGPKGSNITLQIGRNPDPSNSLGVVVNEILENAGNTWFAWVNNVEKGGFDLLLVQQYGNEIKPVERVFINDGQSIKPYYSDEKAFLEGIAEPLAYDTLDSNLDSWDTLYWFGKKNYGKNLNPIGAVFNYLPEGISPFKPDISRHRVQYINEQFEKGNFENPRTWSFFDTGFGKDWSEPGRLEYKLIWKPIWDDILQLEKGRNREARQDEIENIFRQRARELFRSRSDSRFRDYFSAHDIIKLINGASHFTNKVPIRDKERNVIGYKDEVIRYDEATMEELRGSVDPNMNFLNEDYKDKPSTGFWR